MSGLGHDVLKRVLEYHYRRSLSRRISSTCNRHPLKNGDNDNSSHNIIIPQRWYEHAILPEEERDDLR